MRRLPVALYLILIKYRTESRSGYVYIYIYIYIYKYIYMVTGDLINKNSVKLGLRGFLSSFIFPAPQSITVEY
jgi:hypothetical protein